MDSVLKSTGYFNSFDGSSIYYEVRGEGDPVVFCYGIGCLFNHWSPQVAHFSKTHETVMFDYRGHHKTSIPEDKETLTIESLAKDVIALCEERGYEKVNFVGHSFGCQVLLQANKLRPDLFKNLIFVNGLYRNPLDAMVEADDLVEIINQAKTLYNKAPNLLSSIWQKGVTNPLLVPLSALTGGFNLSKTALKDIEIYAKGVSAIDVRVFITFFEDMIAFNEKEYLSKLRTPTLIICGSKDALTPLEEQERMNELIPNSELYVVPYGSHCTQLDFPEMVNLKIQQFIS
ncbi:MAG: alpha/beta hydrolase [Bdellovibrionales bacterium]|nr:alpha/beta hydrolase [Bdellovibrionales bacterium]NQZ18835.1 alpha/beta hydrolase [Bdellovibrionales bacterium]